MKKKLVRYLITGASIISLVLCYIVYSNLTAPKVAGDGLDEVELLTEPITGYDVLPKESLVLLERQGKQLVLSYDEFGLPLLSINDTDNNHVWKAYATEEDAGIENTKAQAPHLGSVLAVSYINFSADNNGVLLVDDTTEISYRVQDGKTYLLFDFTAKEIQVTLCLYFEKGQLCASIPFNGLRENGENRIVSIELFPVFDPAVSSDDGYAFLPDGSGTLLRYSNELPSLAYMTWNIYSDNQADLDQMAYDEERGQYNALVPVFGGKRENSAYVAYITSGSCDAEIKFSPSGYKLNCYRTSAVFRYRERFTYESVGGQTISSVDPHIIPNDFEIHYAFLYGAEANYSGMASIYRNYLLENGLLKQVIDEQDTLPLAVDFLGGVKEERVLSDKFIAMTTFAEVQEALETFQSKGVSNIQTMIFGWQKNGFNVYPATYPPASGLGGATGLKQLADYTSEKGIDLFLAHNAISASDGVDGFTKSTDVIYGPNGLIVTNSDKSKFLMNPFISWTYFEKDTLANLKEFPISGIAFESVGKTIYSDFNSKRYAVRRSVVDTFMKMAGASKETFGKAATEGGNMYTYAHSDRIYSLPDKSSNYFFYNESIPFVQMILHGSIPYSSLPGNFSDDLTIKKLKWIEYGEIPSFLLTGRDMSELRYSSMETLFSSQASKWTDRITELYQEVSNELGNLYSQYIISHEKVGENVYRVEYSGGDVVFINYNKTMVTVSGVTVEACDYTLAEGI